MRVIAPGSIPRAPGDRVKTDRRDAKRIVRLFAAGELSFAFVPSEADERFRDLVRCVEDARKDLMRSRHRLSKFLLRRGLRFPARAWTQPHERWLRKLTFEDALSQAVFVDYLRAVDALVRPPPDTDRCARGRRPGEQPRADGRPVALLPRRSTRSRRPGCAPRSAASSGSPSRVCCRGSSGSSRREYTSDSKRVQGQITKAGSTHRAADCWSRPRTTTVAGPRIGEALAARQAGQDPRVVQIAWRAQRRLLRSAGQHLAGERGKHTGTVAVACARELAAFCWEAATLN